MVNVPRNGNLPRSSTSPRSNGYKWCKLVQRRSLPLDSELACHVATFQDWDQWWWVLTFIIGSIWRPGESRAFAVESGSSTALSVHALTQRIPDLRQHKMSSESSWSQVLDIVIDSLVDDESSNRNKSRIHKSWVYFQEEQLKDIMKIVE